MGHIVTNNQFNIPDALKVTNPLAIIMIFLYILLLSFKVNYFINLSFNATNNIGSISFT